MSETLGFFLTYKKLLKTYKKYNFIQNNLSKLIVFCEWKSKWVIHSKKGVICSFALLSWANRSQSLFCPEHPERFSHGCSFVMSNLSTSLTVAHLSWAIWVNGSQLLIKISNFEQMSNERMSKFPTLQNYI